MLYGCDLGVVIYVWSFDSERIVVSVFFFINESENIEKCF